MSNRKGNRRERQAAELYERAGYETYRPQESKYGETDIYGLFDILAVGWAPEPTHLVQVKANRAAGIEDWSEAALAHAAEGVRVRMLVCHDREGWRVLDPVPGGYQVVCDEREQDCAMGEGLAAFLAGDA